LLGETGTGYRLHTSGRYAHFADYILACGAGAGFADARTERIPLRKEFGEPVDGLLVSFVRPK